MKSALVIGASRGIGRRIALTLSKNNYQVGVAAKTTDHTLELPGTIYSVTNEIETSGRTALALPCNVRDEQQIQNAIQSCLEAFGGLDFVVYNAGAILWKKVLDTPVKRFDLMQEVNVRGAYIMIQKVLPYFLEKKAGKILLVCPPIYSRFFKGKVPYSVGKVGMTVLVHGLATELENTGVSISGLWPATAIESHVTTVKNVPQELMRKSSIFADACLHIAEETNLSLINGKALIDEDFLRAKGVTDFSAYRCDPDKEPPRMMPKAFPSLLVEGDSLTSKL
ncbi:hydroxysteroid dehydrogenase-like protein 2 [Liolophura sinensis]|uniref:hydroxysteroid dehydrogenase-like protein 2 n=1 Tax=Liolophura sinensis TaxID=3198878 RepID=UPI003158C5C4